MTIWRDFWHRAHRGLDAPLTAKVTGTRRGEIAFERLEDTHSRFLKARRTVDVFLSHRILRPRHGAIFRCSISTMDRIPRVSTSRPLSSAPSRRVRRCQL
jgi:hypothetical protein